MSVGVTVERGKRQKVALKRDLVCIFVFVLLGSIFLLHYASERRCLYFFLIYIYF